MVSWNSDAIFVDAEGILENELLYKWFTIKRVYQSSIKRLTPLIQKFSNKGLLLGRGICSRDLYKGVIATVLKRNIDKNGNSSPSYYTSLHAKKSPLEDYIIS